MALDPNFQKLFEEQIQRSQQLHNQAIAEMTAWGTDLRAKLQDQMAAHLTAANPSSWLHDVMMAAHRDAEWQARIHKEAKEIMTQASEPSKSPEEKSEPPVTPETPVTT